MYLNYFEFKLLFLTIKNIKLSLVLVKATVMLFSIANKKFPHDFQ